MIRKMRFYEIILSIVAGLLMIYPGALTDLIGLVLVVLVIVLGVVSLSKMTTDLLPDMSFQYALIITTDVGQNQLWTTQYIEIDENKCVKMARNACFMLRIVI